MTPAREGYTSACSHTQPSFIHPSPDVHSPPLIRVSCICLGPDLLQQRGTPVQHLRRRVWRVPLRYGQTPVQHLMRQMAAQGSFWTKSCAIGMTTPRDLTHLQLLPLGHEFGNDGLLQGSLLRGWRGQSQAQTMRGRRGDGQQWVPHWAGTPATHHSPPCCNTSPPQSCRRRSLRRSRNPP